MFKDYNKAKDELLNYLYSVADALKSIGDTACEKNLRVQIEDLRRQRFNIAVIGGIKRGKSTLINTLLQQRDDTISPIDVGVCTGAVIRYLDISRSEIGDKAPHALVWIGDETEARRIEWDEIRAYVSEESNANNVRNLTRIEVYGDFPMLKNCCLVDTPGDNACIERHGEQVREFLPMADAVIMTIMASQPMSNNDHILFSELSDKNPENLFYAVTRLDSERKADIPEIVNYVKNELPAGSKIYPTGCKPIFEALCNYESQETVDKLSREHGLSKLTHDLEKFILEHSQDGRDMTSRVRRMLEIAKQRLQSQVETNNAIIRGQEIDAGKLHEAIEVCKKELQELERSSKKHLQKFERAWNAEVNRINYQLDGVSSDIADAVDREVRNAGLISAISNIWKFEAIVGKCAKEPLSHFYKEVETRLADIADKFNDDVEESVRLFNSRIKEEFSIMDKVVSGVLGGTLATCSTMGGVAAAEAITAAVAAYHAPIVASSGGLWAAAASWLGFGSGAAIKTSAASALATACASAAAPVLAGAAALLIAKPLAKSYLQGKRDGAVSSKLKAAEEELRKHIDRIKGGIVLACEQNIAERKKLIEEQLEELESKIRNINPEICTNAENQNKQISALIEQGVQLRLMLKN